MPRIFSGIQPSGELHIGNWLGAVQNWVRLQQSYDCLFCVVDLHAITGRYEAEALARRTWEMAVGLLAAGIDPERATLFVQSHVPEHTELQWLFNTVTPIGELERMTQFKDKSTRFESVPAGLLTYPVLMAADILLYRADLVPVGEDQVQHIELSREVARKFNARFGDVFPEPQEILSMAPRILGVDGQAKMSKSLGNFIGILEEEGSVWEKLRTAVTDVNRVRRTDPGDPGICNIYTIHRAFSDNSVLIEIDKGCTTAGIGCIDCKKMLFENLKKELTPIREKAHQLTANIDYVKDVLSQGAAACKEIATVTMGEVRKVMGLYRP